MRSLNKYLLWILLLLAFNTCKKSDPTNPFDSETPKSIWTPTNFVAVQLDNAINLTWSQKETNISGFKIDRKVGSGDWSNVASPGKTATSWSDNSLTGGQLHEYKIYAVAGSNQSNTVTASETPILNALLTAKAATNITETQATLNGSVNANGSTTNVRFLYKREYQTSWTTIAANPQTVTGNSLTDVSVTISGLFINENHEFKIVASNTSGETESSIVTFKTKCYKALIEVLQPTNKLITSITLNASVNPIYTTTTVSCEYGETTNYGSSANASPSTVDGGNSYNDVSVQITGLKPGTVYYYKILAENCGGITESSSSFVTTAISLETGTIEDSRDGKTYKTVKIGDQWWMAENLAYLPSINRPTEGSVTSPRYYVFDYGTNPLIKISVFTAKTTENYKNYGVLYNWLAAKAACLKGWHLPTDAEWEQLAKYISNDNGGYGKTDDDWLGVGKHLKSKTGWKDNGNGTDDYGFSGLPGGGRNFNDLFIEFDTGYWWSATDFLPTYSYFRSLSYIAARFVRVNTSNESGLSVRCVKD